jgi:hypothetical protein
LQQQPLHTTTKTETCQSHRCHLSPLSDNNEAHQYLQDTAHSPRMIGAVRRIQTLQASRLGDSAACIAPNNVKSIQQEAALPKLCLLLRCDLRFQCSSERSYCTWWSSSKTVITASHHEGACVRSSLSPSLAFGGSRRAHDGLVYASCFGTRRQAHVSSHGARGMDEWCARG